MPTKVKKTHPKKELREKLSIQLHMILAGFKELVDEKKLHKLVKKAGKLLADGLHHKPTKPKPAKKVASTIKVTAPKKIAVSKPKPVKKTAKKSVKKTPAKK